MEYRERRKAYDKLEDIKQLKESIKRVTNTSKPQEDQSRKAGKRPTAVQNKPRRGGQNFFADEEEDEAIVDEQSFSVGGSEIDEDHLSNGRDDRYEDEEAAAIDSSGK